VVFEGDFLDAIRGIARGRTSLTTNDHTFGGEPFLDQPPGLVRLKGE
jgi:hypothetical protein